MEEIKPIDFLLIESLWRTHLWPQRTVPIAAVSAMRLGGGIDVGLMRKQPHFFGAFLNGELVGGVSGFETAPRVFRVRGLIVVSERRGRGLGQRLLQTIIGLSEERGDELQWTAPRPDNLAFYEKAGFVKITDWTRVLFDPGPNCYAVRCSRGQ